MNLSVPTKSARLTCATRRSYQSMNHILLLAVSAIVQCKRFTQYLTSSLKVVASTLLTSNLRNTALTCTYADSLDRPGTLQARALKGLTPGRLRLARGVAFVIGISLSIPMASADSGSIDAITPKRYIQLTLPKKEAVCLSRLIGKESAWNHKAIGNLGSPTKSYVYGLLQLKNPIVKDKSPIEQIHYGLKYINHRYQGNACNAWKHWKDKGWH
jgi:hypothetical protein